MKYITSLVAFMTPAVASAATDQNLRSLIELIISYFGLAIRFIVSLAVIVFIWNVYRYFFKADVENKKEAGLYVMYSVIGFFVILSIWGLVNILVNTFELDSRVPSMFGGLSGGGDSSSSEFIQNTGGRGSF